MKKRRLKTEAELRAAHAKALDRAEWLRDEIRDRRHYADSDELEAMREAWDEAMQDLQIAREDLEEAGYKLRPARAKTTRRRR